jgi:5-methylthioribose kinase
MTETEELLAEDTVVDWLLGRDVLRGTGPWSARRLAGGVSNVVLGVRGPQTDLVVKQAMARLDVPGEWFADRRRTIREARALEVAAALTPDHAPRPVLVDADALALVMPAAPDGWVTLKDELLEGRCDPGVITGLAGVLATWHTQTAAHPERSADCHDPSSLPQLRTDPYHRVIAGLHPDLAPVILDCVAELESARDCLVHGDLSPKNVMVGRAGDDMVGGAGDGMVGRGGFWVIDFEVVHIGAPVFDVAFLLSHLLLKAVHRPAHRETFADAARTFWSVYAEQVAPALRPAPDRLVAQLGCLLLARVDGRSPASYLSPAETVAVRTLAVGMLADPPADLDDTWRRQREVAGAA